MKKTYLILLLIILGMNISFSQNVPNNFYLPSDHRALNKYTDENPSGNSISDMITIGDTIWVGTGNGLSVSYDNGENWKNFYATAVFGDHSISAMCYYKGTMWVATATTTTDNGQSYPQGTGLKYTTDAGNTWNSIPQPTDSQSDTIITYGINELNAVPVTTTIQNLTYDIAVTNGTVWTASFAGGLRKSTDMGQTWQRVVLPPDYLNSIKPTDSLYFCVSPVPGNICSEGYLNYRVFSLANAGDSIIYVGTADGINKSTDDGQSWTKFNHQNQEYPISGNFVVALSYNNSNNSLWAATWRAEEASEYYAVSWTTDQGDTWQTTLNNQQTHNFGFKNNDVIAATDNGPFRTNFGSYNTWILPTSIVDNTTKIELTTKIFYSAGSSNNYVWIGSNDGLARINESSGNTWQGIWKVFFASQKLTSKSETHAFPNPFSPKLDRLKIKYSTGGKTANVTIRIFDFGMNYVRTIIQNAQRGSTYHEIDAKGTDTNGVIDFWDGKDDSGKVVPNGVYFYRIDVDSQDPSFR